VTLGSLEERTLEFSLVKEAGVWKVDSLAPLLLLAGAP
jgi:hypothetical protein